MNIIRTVEQLTAMVTGENALIKTRTRGLRGDAVQEVVIADGELDLEDAKVMGLVILFKRCKIKGGFWTRFVDCAVHFQDCTTQDIELSYSMVTLKGCTAVNTNVYLEEMFLGAGNKITSSVIQPSVLRGSGEDVLAIHKDDTNALGGRVSVRGATASVVNFGTYVGNAHYFAESDMVIAGCWQGKLENFKWKARKRGVEKESYEAVYNYFKSFK